MNTNTLENCLAASYKVKHLLYDTDVPFLTTYLGKMKVYVYTKLYMPVFTAAFFIMI